uniref:THAP domain-containing protein 1 n=1 Tax=Sipha flava TaxID=143950 RepID=A0A2S2QE34_9HEMI
MVNKCSVAGCKSLYVKKDNVKLHRFPLTNSETLPIWIAATGREKGWKPCKSSRLCGNHFQESEYIVGHGKGVLKATAIPTIEYHIDNPKYRKNKYSYSNNDTGKNNKPNQVESVDYSNVEIVQLNYNDIYDSKYEHRNKDITDNTSVSHGESFYQNEYEEIKSNKNISTENKLQNMNIEIKI